MNSYWFFQGCSELKCELFLTSSAQRQNTSHTYMRTCNFTCLICYMVKKKKGYLEGVLSSSSLVLSWKFLCNVFFCIACSLSVEEKVKSDYWGLRTNKIKVCQKKLGSPNSRQKRGLSDFEVNLMNALISPFCFLSKDIVVAFIFIVV